MKDRKVLVREVISKIKENVAGNDTRGMGQEYEREKERAQVQRNGKRDNTNSACTAHVWM